MEKTDTSGSEMPSVDIAIAAGKDDSASSAGIEIPVPSGFEAPEDAAKGGSFDVLATVKMEGGKLMLEAIDGLPVESQAVSPDEETTAENEAEMGQEEPGESEAMPTEDESAAEGDFMAAIERGLAGKKKK